MLELDDSYPHSRPQTYSLISDSDLRSAPTVDSSLGSKIVLRPNLLGSKVHANVIKTWPWHGLNNFVFPENAVHMLCILLSLQVGQAHHAIQTRAE